MAEEKKAEEQKDEKQKDMNERERINFLLSFLMIIVDRAGGMLEIGNIDQYKNTAFDINMKFEENAVVLTTAKVEKKFKPQIIGPDGRPV